jgi:hypothetical protein
MLDIFHSWELELETPPTFVRPELASSTSWTNALLAVMILRETTARWFGSSGYSKTLYQNWSDQGKANVRHTKR